MMSKKSRIHLVAPSDVAQLQLRPRVVTPLVLKPIAWGSRDRELGLAVCKHLQDAIPPVTVLFNPFTHNKVRRVLTSMGVPH